MGAYLSQPNTVKCSGDGVGAPRLPLPYGFSAMQGWRVSMEDAHNCIPELDNETAMFSVYDGHGGEEVALYCAKYLPDIIKDQKAYKEGKLQKALQDAFLAIDAKLTTDEVIKELAQIAGRPTEDEDDKEKVADEDDVDNEEAALLHEEATMTIEELLTRYGQNCQKGPPHTKSGTGIGDEPEPQGLNGEAGPEDPSRETPSQENGPTAKGHTGPSSNSDHGTEAGQIGEPGTATGEAGPSCSSASDKLPRVAKSKFFEDSEDESDEVEEEEDDSEEPGSDSGTTAVVALIRGKQLIVANAGDSRCVVSEAGKALDMSYDHKPEDEVELARIKNAGGKVTMDGRVNGGLNLSRAIGDHFYKRNKNLPPQEQMISALPDIKVLTLTDDHEFMVIACDGIWNVMSSQEVVDFIQSKISQRDENGELRLLSSIVEELLDQCLAPDTSGDGTGCDNMTCIIICFKPRNTVELQPESGKRKLEEALSTEGAEENGNSDKKKAKRD
ncbi:protein phosphatase 1G (formerly 2C), magnesium-dependent, gamma isoform, isoform CRA_a [Rattus norvegicus]|uniref:Protein phosphatase 1G n=1 Tax=Rattus norvegicus TaxID=10116 RepID=A6HA65_RAT|nr:protein phosphatase 1G (formerly 2C), magnesium-dependent, gamma isoform, isoform CRA_a [Rattus norvegicus]